MKWLCVLTSLFALVSCASPRNIKPDTSTVAICVNRHSLLREKSIYCHTVSQTHSWYFLCAGKPLPALYHVARYGTLIVPSGPVFYGDEPPFSSTVHPEPAISHDPLEPTSPT